ncbi:DUF533 domain-containing protein [Microbaculum marinum]|uniref:DUF533 domain-containing protein n=1 Tax=Microbaculum marinum TaxID=1764581 RepID=A0AAW9RU15_9HYPH
MNFANMVGQLMREGLSPATQSRLQNAVGQNSLGGLGDILGNVMGGSGAFGSGQGGGLGDVLGSLQEAMKADSGVGNLSRGQVGGIGALAGAILGGGSVKGAVGGGAMAVLATLALAALKDRQAPMASGQSAPGNSAPVQSAPGQSAGVATATAAPAVAEAELRRMTSQETAELCLHAMVEAAKSDGQIAPDEIRRILGKVEEYGMPAEERTCLMDLLGKPQDVDGLVAAIPSREVGAQVYTAALMAITVDTPEERGFLSKLAAGAALDAATVARLHAMVGAPAPGA